MQLATQPIFLLLILLVIFPAIVLATKDQEQDQDHEQECSRLRRALGVLHHRDFFHGVGYFFAEATAPDVAGEKHLKGGR